ncbi:ABC transporter ATP-binding protein, partial [Pseudomonas aeruginosa]|nr:ABC transporter ATP-binding protein [Pseudomonas aeruginosa]
RLDGQRIEVLLDDAERDGVLEALLAAREFDLEILPPSLEDLYRHHMSPAPAGATPCP